MPLVGSKAPEFELPVFDPNDPTNTAKTIKLSDYQGIWLVFFWYPLDFTFVCPTEITAMSDRLDEFQEIGAEVLGASTDSIYSHKAWASTPRDKNGIAGLRYPIAADMTHSVARDYGVLLEEEGVALRGLFIIDPEGVLQFSTIHSLNVGRSVDEVLRVLQALQTGGLCPADWRPGQKTLGG
ncbi:MAG TPA: peroxiredoxin [Armatimonadetes bacterium]|jgi:peroxiredoxin (alkyl hydroperoxide reductase subunit C)|nr:peroxiredoxin [Armatimonadota bacterium]